MLLAQVRDRMKAVHPKVTERPNQQILFQTTDAGTVNLQVHHTPPPHTKAAPETVVVSDRGDLAGTPHERVGLPYDPISNHATAPSTSTPSIVHSRTCDPLPAACPNELAHHPAVNQYYQNHPRSTPTHTSHHGPADPVKTSTRTAPIGSPCKPRPWHPAFFPSKRCF